MTNLGFGQDKSYLDKQKPFSTKENQIVDQTNSMFVRQIQFLIHKSKIVGGESIFDNGNQMFDIKLNVQCFFVIITLLCFSNLNVVTAFQCLAVPVFPNYSMFSMFSKFCNFP